MIHAIFTAGRCDTRTYYRDAVVHEINGLIYLAAGDVIVGLAPHQRLVELKESQVRGWTEIGGGSLIEDGHGAAYIAQGPTKAEQIEEIETHHGIRMMLAEQTRIYREQRADTIANEDDYREHPGKAPPWAAAHLRILEKERAVRARR